MTLNELLLSLAINVSSNAIYDFIVSGLPAPREEVIKRLNNHLLIHGVRVDSDCIVDFLATNGDIDIKGSRIFAKGGVTMKSGPNSKLTFGDGSRSSTEKSVIEAGIGASLQAQGQAGVVQDADGNIRFFT